jgi:hypothetical protein
MVFDLNGKMVIQLMIVDLNVLSIKMEPELGNSTQKGSQFNSIH